MSAIPVHLVDSETDWAAWITAVATAVTAGILGGTAWLALRGLGDAKRTRHGQLVVDLTRRWSELQPTIRQFARVSNDELAALIDRLFGGGKATEDDLELFDALTAYPNLTDTIGVLEEEGVLDSRLVHKLWGPLIVSQWNGWSQAVEHLRRYDNQDAEAAYLYFQRIAEKMVCLDKRRGEPQSALKHLWSCLREFWRCLRSGDECRSARRENQEDGEPAAPQADL